MSKAVEEEAAVYPNIELIITDANGDAEKLTSDVEDVLAKKVDGIILSGAWLEAAPGALDAITKAGVPVVMVDRKVSPHRVQGRGKRLPVGACYGCKGSPGHK